MKKYHEPLKLLGLYFEVFEEEVGGQIGLVASCTTANIVAQSFNGRYSLKARVLHLIISEAILQLKTGELA